MNSYLTINDVIDITYFDGFPDKELDALEQLQARTVIDECD